MFVVELVFQTRQNRRCVGADVSLSTLTSSEQVKNWMVAYEKKRIFHSLRGGRTVVASTGTLTFGKEWWKILRDTHPALSLFIIGTYLPVSRCVVLEKNPTRRQAVPGFEPGTSTMQSERSTRWATVLGSDIPVLQLFEPFQCFPFENLLNFMPALCQIQTCLMIFFCEGLILRLIRLQWIFLHFNKKKIRYITSVRRETISWPARSPDLMPNDFFLRGYVKFVGNEIVTSYMGTKSHCEYDN